MRLRVLLILNSFYCWSVLNRHCPITGGLQQDYFGVLVLKEGRASCLLFAIKYMGPFALGSLPVVQLTMYAGGLASVYCAESHRVSELHYSVGGSAGFLVSVFVLLESVMSSYRDITTRTLYPTFFLTRGTLQSYMSMELVIDIRYCTYIHTLYMHRYNSLILIFPFISTIF